MIFSPILIAYFILSAIYGLGYPWIIPNWVLNLGTWATIGLMIECTTSEATIIYMHRNKRTETMTKTEPTN